MRTGIPFLTGLAMALAGASIRSCEMPQASLVTYAWCGPATHAARLGINSTHQEHCIGCVALAAGLVVMAISLLLAGKNRLMDSAQGSR